MRGEYTTKQRALILNFIKESSSHLTVYDIIEGLKLQGVSVGKATIYRTLEKMCEGGMVRKFVIDQKSGACYQYARDTECTNHFHLKCLKCGKLIHLSCSFMSEMESHILAEHNFKVSSGKTVIYGVCNECSLPESRENLHKF